MNRREMAEFFFYQSEWPVRNAITAASLLRKMSSMPAFDPTTCQMMLENADYFEDLAVGIQLQAFKDDHKSAKQSLCVPLVIWKRLSLLDLVMESNCVRFVEACCATSTKDFGAGDIDHERTSWMYSKMLLCILSGGSLFFFLPNLINFKPPPFASVVRISTQRRRLPKGYPFRPHDNKVLGRLFATYSRSTHEKSSVMLKKVIGIMTKIKHDPNTHVKDEEFSLLWSYTFTSWERCCLFWWSPMVLFLANALIQVFFTVVFTIFLACYEDSLDVSFLGPREWFPIIEVGILVYFATSLVREVFQATVFATLHEYLMDRWNLIDLVTITSFLVGFGLHRGIDHEDHEVVGQPHVSTPVLAWKALYGVSLGLLWVRLLRLLAIFETLGLFVLMFWRMLEDVLVWIVLYLVFVFCFSSILMGAGDTKGLLDKCNIEGSSRRQGQTFMEAGEPGDYLYMSCNQNFVHTFLRTWFQGWGELFLDEMTNNESVLVLIVAFLILNVVLLNLLIARLSGTYEEVSNEAGFQRVQDVHKIYAEHSRGVLAIPPPFNIVFILAELLRFTYFYWDMCDMYKGCNLRTLLDIYLSRKSNDDSTHCIEVPQDRREAVRYYIRIHKHTHTHAHTHK